MAEFKALKLYFSIELAEILKSKILEFYPNFNAKLFIDIIKEKVDDLELKDRNILFANALKESLTGKFSNDLGVLVNILGEENTQETGMFYNYYHLWPIGTFVEKYGLNDYNKSMEFIEELTKRFTGEFAVRNLIVHNPQESLKYFEKWSKSDNFHLRRLSSEGIRPKLPWAKKLDVFIEDPAPVFNILENLKKDEVKFVQKSVANNINDYLKLNENKALELLRTWAEIEDKNTFWIIKHALRNYKKAQNPIGLEIINHSAKVNKIENYR